MHSLDIGKHARQAYVLAELLDPSHPIVFDIPMPWQVDEISPLGANCPVQDGTSAWIGLFRQL